MDDKNDQVAPRHGVQVLSMRSAVGLCVRCLPLILLMKKPLKGKNGAGGDGTLKEKYKDRQSPVLQKMH